ncbi:MAG TPA: hypothetical protein VNO26_15600 [Candidatus Limnocylindria bacterium]|nr:hypothetical protein [Candidatus Limnocylindria bacterium]
MKRAAWGIVLGMVVGTAATAGAQQQIVLQEVLGSWRADETLQFIELVMVDDLQNATAGRAALVFQDATGSTQQTFLFTKDMPIGVLGASILVATARFGEFAQLVPDLVLPTGMLSPSGGRVCYRAANALGEFSTIDCLAYGSYSGGNGTFGSPVRAAPTNRSLDRVRYTGINRTDWEGQLRPTARRNDGTGVVLVTQCGNGAIDLGEDCDGDDLDGATCQSLGYVRGKLRCSQCQYNTNKCTFCGNDELNDGEQCDGTDLDDTECTALGFTGGTLACTEKCKFDTAGCSPTFYVPGKGPKKHDCLAEWLIENAGQKPGADGKAKTTQKCTQGDPGCDFDADPTTCTFRVAVCFRLADARLPTCSAGTVATWELKKPPLDAGSAAGALLDAVAALGGTESETTVTFTPPLDAGSPCTAPVLLAVPVKQKLKLKAKTSDGAGDSDALTLDCRP